MILNNLLISFWPIIKVAHTKCFQILNKNYEETHLSQRFRNNESQLNQLTTLDAINSGERLFLFLLDTSQSCIIFSAR